MTLHITPEPEVDVALRAEIRDLSAELRRLRPELTVLARRVAACQAAVARATAEAVDEAAGPARRRAGKCGGLLEDLALYFSEAIGWEELAEELLGVTGLLEAATAGVEPF